MGKYRLHKHEGKDLYSQSDAGSGTDSQWDGGLPWRPGLFTTEAAADSY